MTQAATFLTASIFEMKDSLINSGDFSQAQLKNSKDDLTSAEREIERIQQEIIK